jgi:hypothetical protein
MLRPYVRVRYTFGLKTPLLTMRTNNIEALLAALSPPRPDCLIADRCLLDRMIA